MYDGNFGGSRMQAGTQHIKESKLSTVSTAFLTWEEWKCRALARQERKALHKLQVALLRQPRQEATAHLRALPFCPEGIWPMSHS